MSVCIIALSGGVDSSVAALLLKKDWERLVGASHLILPNSRCCSAKVLQRAREICRRLDIPYVQVDLFPEFKEKVVGNFIDTYLEGKTPNPCVACNRYIRFDLFYKKLKSLLKDKALLQDGEELFFSTGHYARVEKMDGGYFLVKARDPLKDQSYMLYRIHRGMLEKLVFPLGDYLKKEVSELAEAGGLEYTRVKESQDACFVDSDYVDFISRQTERDDILQKGEIVDPAGNLLGLHRGYIHYTVGQRRGLGLGSGPWYVSRIEPENNRVVAARPEEARRTCLLVDDLNWFIDKPLKPLLCRVKVRYQTRDIPCRIEPEGERIRVLLKKGEIVTPGQSAVFYDHNLVLGGGTIV